MSVAGSQVLSQDVLVACIFLGLTALVGIVSNGLMLRALYFYKNLRNEFLLLLGSVALSDILSLTIAVPKNIIYITSLPNSRSVDVTDSWCRVANYLEAGTAFVASYHLVLLATFRAILLTSRQHNPPTSYRTVLCCYAIWVISMVSAIPFLFSMEEAKGCCRYHKDIDIEKDTWLLHSFSCFVPLIFIALIYVLTYIIGKRYFEDSYSFKERQISRLVTAVVAAQFICQIPYRVLDLNVYFFEKLSNSPNPEGETREALIEARNYLLCLFIAEKAARPIIYSKLGPQEVANAFDEVINCTSCHLHYTQNRSPAQSNTVEIGSKPIPFTTARSPLIEEAISVVRDQPEIVTLSENCALSCVDVQS